MREGPTNLQKKQNGYAEELVNVMAAVAIAPQFVSAHANPGVAYPAGTVMQYEGPSDGKTRRHCRAALARGPKTLAEWRVIWAAQWRGKTGSDPVNDVGGYNCRHMFRIISYPPNDGGSESSNGGSSASNSSDDNFGQAGASRRRTGHTSDAASTLHSARYARGRPPSWHPTEGSFRPGNRRAMEQLAREKERNRRRGFQRTESSWMPGRRKR